MIDKDEILTSLLSLDFSSFVAKVFHEISSNDKFLANWHIDLICSELMKIEKGEYNKIIVNIPPRNLKSIICSVALPAFLLGHNPKCRIICVSYSDDLSSKFANDCKIVMESKWYKKLFPGTRLSPSRRAVNDFETTKNGGRFSTTVNGTLTGRGADWIIIDDPQSPNQTLSDTQINKLNNWYGSTLCSRLNNKNTGKILLIMQRLHQNDLTGFLLSNPNNGFKHICLPLIATEDENWTIERYDGKTYTHIRKEGELLHPEREDEKSASELRYALGEYAFAGQYQQSPTPSGGGLVKKEWFQYYNDPIKASKEIFISWDTASKTGVSNAYSAAVVLRRDRSTKKIYVLECYRGRLEFPDLLDKVKELNDKYYAIYKTRPENLIEDASSGTSVLQSLIGSRAINCTAIKPNGNKIDRFNIITAPIRNGTLLFPAEAGHWWKELTDELLSFPNCTFKDQCDALSQGVSYILSNPPVGYF